MKEPIVARSYAKALFSIAKEKNFDVAKELTNLTELINATNDLENLLFMDIFTVEEKKSVLNEIISKMDFNAYLAQFLHFLIDEKRMGILPLVFKDIIVIDDDNKGFMRGTIEGADDSISDELKEKIQLYMEKKINKKTEMEYKKSNTLTAGFKVTVGDLQVDASLENQLEQLKNNILK